MKTENLLSESGQKLKFHRLTRIFIKNSGERFSLLSRLMKDIFSLAIKSCNISNVDESKNLLLINDFCETEESASIVRKNLDGKFLDILLESKVKNSGQNNINTFESFLFQIFKFPKSQGKNRRKCFQP